MENEKIIINRQNSMKEKQKRVQRLKRIIIFVVVFLLIVPLICCITCVVKIVNLEKKVNSLVSLHDSEYQNFITEKETDQQGKVYAAETEATAKPEEIKKDFEDTEKTNVEKQVKQDGVDHQKIKGKKVYLTFDDGPSINTEKILNTLKEYNVKATFFVIGKTDEFSKKMYRRIVDEGHTLAMHSYTHEYSKIYKSVDAFEKDLVMLSDLLYEVTEIRPKYMRFPGGSSNTISKLNMRKFISYVNKKELIYYDWNVVNGDATGKKISVNELVDNVIKGVDTYDTSMILMHDAAARVDTAKSLPAILKKLKKKKDVYILPINDTTSLIQHIKADTVE